MKKISILLFATILACSLTSCSSNVFMGRFSGETRMPERSNYLEFDEGQKVYGQKVSWGKLFSNSISIDGQKFKVSEVKGYVSNGVYYGRMKSTYIRRVVSGKLCIYYDIVTSRTYDGQRWSDNISEAYYMQNAGEKEMKRIYKSTDLKKALESCPTAYALVNISNKEMRRAIRKNPSYLNDAVALYNNNCMQ